MMQCTVKIHLSICLNFSLLNLKIIKKKENSSKMKEKKDLLRFYHFPCRVYRKYTYVFYLSSMYIR